MNYFKQKSVANNTQANLFDVFGVTSSDVSVSNEKMKELEEKYNLVPTNDFQSAVADIFFTIKDGDSITHAYAENLELMFRLSNAYWPSAEKCLMDPRLAPSVVALIL